MATRTHSPFETLARVIEHLDDDGRSVRRTEATGSGGDGSLRATVDVSVGTPEEDAGLEPTEAAVDDGLSVTFRAPAFPDPAGVLPAEYPRVSATPTDVWLDGDSVVVTLTVTIGDADSPSGEGDATENGKSGDLTGDEPTDASAGSIATAAFGNTGTGEFRSVSDGADEAGADTNDADTEIESPLAAARDESVPPYDDTPYLRRLYETCETFAEMSERIEMDVSAETVRRYMIEAEVHSPTTYETAGRTQMSSGERTENTAKESKTASEETSGARSATGTGTTEESAADRERSTADDLDAAASLPDEQLVADGIGLPEEMTLHDVVDAVVGARTVHEVQREVGLGYDRTRQLLSQLNVLDLVVGRVSDGSDRTVTVDVVTDRIRQCAPDAA